MASKEKDKKSEKAIDQRPNYFAGQYLLEDDFKLEQKYHIDRQRRHNRLLHVSGIAEGLKVSPDEDKKVKVSAGTAIDSQGRQIILPDDQFVELENVANKKPLEDGGYTLYIRYEEEQTEKQDSEESMARRVQEKPKFELSNEESKSTSPDVIPLAKLTIVGGKVKNEENIDLSVRQYSGICLPTEDGKGVTLRSHDEENNRSHGNENPNLAKLSGSLSISGTLAVTGHMQLNNALTVKGNTTLKQELKVEGKTIFDTDTYFAGKVSIGKQEASKKLEVNGDILAEGNITAKEVTIKDTIMFTPSEVKIKGFSNDEKMANSRRDFIPTEYAIKSYISSQLIKKYYKSEANSNVRLTQTKTWQDIDKMELNINLSKDKTMFFLFKAGGLTGKGEVGKDTHLCQCQCKFKLLIEGSSRNFPPIQLALAVHEFNHESWQLRDVSLMWIGNLNLEGEYYLKVQWCLEKGNEVLLSWFESSRILMAIDLMAMEDLMAMDDPYY